MDESSAEFPIDRVLAACREAIEDYMKVSLRFWDEGGRELPNESREEFLTRTRRFVGGTYDDLIEFCEAARAGGQTKVRLSLFDFKRIKDTYRAN